MKLEELEKVLTKHSEKTNKYFRELINYTSVIAQLNKRQMELLQCQNRLIQDILNKQSKEELNGRN